MKVENYTAND